MKRAMKRTVIWYIDIEHQRTASAADFDTHKRANIEAAAPGCTVESFGTASWCRTRPVSSR
jgi:hypothetical protein